MITKSHVSPSQISTWMQCPRRWGYSRILPRTTNQWAEYGLRVHTYLENWIADGVPPDPRTPEGRTALAGLDNLPLPGEGVVEHAVEISWQGIWYVFRIDLLSNYKPNDIIWISDHKTIGRLQNAKTENDLLIDPQRIIYAWWAALTFDVPYVGTRWRYLQRSPPKNHNVDLVQHVDDVMLAFEQLHIEQTLEIIKAHNVDPQKLLAIPSQLCRYCDAITQCGADLSPQSRLAQSLAMIQ